MTEGLGQCPKRSDYTPTSDSDYAKALQKWQGDFKGFAGELRDNEWVWEAICLDLADTFEEYRQLMQAPLPKVGMWARKKARQVD